MRTATGHAIACLLAAAPVDAPIQSAQADILKNPKEIEPVTGATLGMGWDTTRKKLTNVCIDESMDRLAKGEVAVDTNPNIEEFSMARTATEMAEKMGLNLEIALSAITGIGRISNETKAGLLKQTESSQYSLTLVGRSRETVPEFLDKRGLRLKQEAESLLESELTHPQFRDRCGDAFVLGWLKGHELVARLQITEEAHDRLREVDFQNNLGIASGSYDIDTLIGVSKSSEMSSLRKTVDVKVFRTDSKRSRTDYSDPEAFKRAFFQWQSQVNPLDDGQDLQQDLQLLEAAHTKTAKRRSIPLNAAARAAIVSRARFRAEHCPASPWVFAHKDGERILDVKNSFATACRKAGIKDFRIHDLRHTCAAWLVSKGVPLSEVKELLGHSTINMTERYAHLAPENVRAAVAVLDGESRFGHGAQKDDAEAAEGTSPSA